MILTNAYVRFFRSFNFDYLRRDKEGVDRLPWDVLESDGAFYPFVSVDLQSDITTVVGANESGKSQLITAIRCLLGDAELHPKDFCRYSTFFGVRGDLRLPEVGGHFTSLTELEKTALREIAGPDVRSLDEFWLFRHQGRTRIYLRATNGSYIAYALSQDQEDRLRLPRARVIKADVALPQNVSLYALQRDHINPRERDRKTWYSIHKGLQENETLLDNLPSPQVNALLAKPVPVLDDDEQEKALKSFELARDMLVKVAGINPLTFGFLLDSGSVDDGYGEALAERITDALASALNFPHWWSQDRDFALEVRKDGFFLVLTMRDRTGQTYTFDERSSGMKYFLSYFVQYKAHAPRSDGRGEFILMDEPDAFLSTQGQQDLLQIFEAYAAGSGDDPGAQVLYVTHSPFLIDKNRPDRIRVLQKGAGEEGTRVIKKAGVDKYEPLRSAFGSFHAETAFIGNCNLLVEGPADQVLLPGISSAMRIERFVGSTLDLNNLTLVPVHGASEYRYTLHLTRGRDLDTPAVVVLMDSDAAALAARPDLEKGYKGQQLIDPSLIFAVGELDLSKLRVAVDAIHEPEDLVPAAVARRAIVYFAQEVFSSEDASKVEKALPATLAISAGQRLHDVVAAAAKEASKRCTRRLDLGKIEFARAVCAVARSLPSDEQRDLFSNFSTLFAQIDERQRRASTENIEERTRQTTKRLVERFKLDHRSRASKESVEYLLQQVLHQLPVRGDQTDATVRTIMEIREAHALRDDPRQDVQDFARLRAELKDLIHADLREAEGVD